MQEERPERLPLRKGKKQPFHPRIELFFLPFFWNLEFRVWNFRVSGLALGTSSLLGTLGLQWCLGQ
jgi:hypothetical protein